MKKVLIIVNTLFLALILSSCDDEGIVDRSIDTTTGARISFVNLSPDSPEVNLYFNDVKVTAARSQVANVLRGIPFRSSYPGIVTTAPAATTMPTTYVGEEYFVSSPSTYTIAAKDTAYRKGFTTYFSTSSTFEDGKYYSIYAMDLSTNMTPIIVEDNIVEFQSTNKTKVRVVNALTGATGDVIDIWVIHQPGTGVLPIPAYKIASSISLKTVTSFSDTITGGNYKWIVTAAGAAPTANAAPADKYGKPWTLTFAAADVIYSNTTSTSITTSSTYSMVALGSKGGAKEKSAYCGLFRHRLH
jgi:hypothetical protein